MVVIYAKDKKIFWDCSIAWWKCYKREFIARSVDIANLGYAVLVIDQRGIGQTGGSYPSLQDDYEYIYLGKESIQHLGVY